MRGQPSLWHMSFHIAGDRGKMPIARIEYGSGEVANVSGILCKLSPSATCEARTVVALTTSRKCWSSLDMFAMIRGSSRRYSVSLAKECGDSLVGCDRPRLTYVSHRDGRCANARDLRERHHLQASRILSTQSRERALADLAGRSPSPRSHNSHISPGAGKGSVQRDFLHFSLPPLSPGDFERRVNAYVAEHQRLPPI